MATTTNKQRLVSQLFTNFRKEHETADMEALPVLEQFIYGLCREGVTREQADRSFNHLRDRFFDWNEIRVSSIRELEEAFAGLSDSEARAQRLVNFLQEVFETTFSFDLETLHKEGLKKAAKKLSRFQAANDYIVSWVIQQSLGGHAIPLDSPTLRTTRRLGLIDENADDPEAIRASLEHLIPKSRGLAFGDAVSALADEYCWEESPNCSACPLASDCPTAQQMCSETVSVGRSAKLKPR